MRRLTGQMRFGPSPSYSGMQEGTFAPSVTFLFRSRSEAWPVRRVRARLVIGKPGASPQFEYAGLPLGSRGRECPRHTGGYLVWEYCPC